MELFRLLAPEAGGIVPASVQKFRVDPQELQRETPYIDRNIKATRFAFGIDVQTQSVTPAADLTAAQVEPGHVNNLVVPGSTGTAGGASVVFVSSSARSVFADMRKDGLAGR